MRRLKTKIMAIALAFAVGVSAPATFATNNTIVASAATIKLNKTKVSLTVGKTEQLKLSGTKKAVTWSSSKKTVATVSKTGKVTAKAAGTATITAKSNGKKYTCKVTVTAKKATANEKTYTLDTVTFKLPKDVTVESGTEGTLSMASVELKSCEDSSILISNINLEGEEMDYDLWKETIQETMEAQIELLKLLSEDENIVTDFSCKEVTTTIGKGLYTTYTINADAEVAGYVNIYDIFTNDHWVEVIYMNGDLGDTQCLQASFDMIMKTIAIVK
ncbi:Ig-like domain-containing protein [Anaerosporobacter sp.]|uniref:Ig-like domain-containing protein n=1 Tax=Anaerosporobacter sp. TaxID=1872529 RepID=UPI00286EBD02|nr:Ig-like domain-containing protein [Anaerosporobacter sp.]